MSSFPLVRLSAKYIEMTTNGQILSNRAALEIVRKRVQQLLERLEQDEAPDRLKKLFDLWEEYKKATGSDQVHAKIELDNEFEKVYHDYASWKQIFEALDLDRKMVESELKVVKEIKAWLTAEDAYELEAKLLASVMSAINASQISPDDRTYLLKRITYEFTRIAGDKADSRFGGGHAEDDNSGPDYLDREGVLDPGDEARSDFEGENAPKSLPEGLPPGSPGEG